MKPGKPIKRTPLKSDPEKRRAWLARSRLAEAARRVRNPLKKRGAKYHDKRKRAFGKKAEFVRAQDCDTCGAPGPSDVSHYPSRGAGGRSEHTFPQCRRCHADMHQYGVDSFLGWKLKNKAWLVERTRYWERCWKEAE